MSAHDYKATRKASASAATSTRLTYVLWAALFCAVVVWAAIEKLTRKESKP